MEISNIVANFLIVIAPFILVPQAYSSWMRYRRLKYQYLTDTVLIELKLPPEVYRSPKAMEFVFSALYQKNDGTKAEVFLDGKQRPHFSFEIMSDAGQIHFYVWIAGKKFLPLVKNNFYSQYPGLEIEEIPVEDDYLKKINWDPAKRFIWGTYWKLKSDEGHPIVTYKEYELEKNPDKEVEINPFNTLVEYLGSLSYGEKAYLQFVIRANGEDDWTSGNVRPFKKVPDQRKKIDELIAKIKKDNTIKNIADDSEDAPLISYEPGMTDYIKKLRTLQSKFFFETMIRGMYVTDNETFNSGNISGLIGTMQQFSHAGGNSFKLSGYTDLSDDKKDWLRVLNIKFLEKRGIKQRGEMEQDFLAAIKRRSGFYPPDKGNLDATKPMNLSTEELATIYHLPDTSATTPTLSRVDAVKADPPANLPV